MCKSDCIKMILTRRSVRKYSEKNIEDEKIKIILKAAMQAPSSKNSQPWHFVVVKKREILDEMARRHPYGKMLHSAKAAIVVCADSKLKQKQKDALASGLLRCHTKYPLSGEMSWNRHRLAGGLSL